MAGARGYLGQFVVHSRRSPGRTPTDLPTDQRPTDSRGRRGDGDATSEPLGTAIRPLYLLERGSVRRRGGRYRIRYTSTVEEWEVRVTDEWLTWFRTVDRDSQALIVDAVDRLADAGPNLGRPLVDRLKGARVHNLKELRPGSRGRSEIRILFVFDPWRSAILLVGGDKSGDWQGWYRRTIPEAERLYELYLTERRNEEE